MPGLSRREFNKKMLRGVGGAALAGATLTKAADRGSTDAPTQPNILFISSDQHAYKYLGCAGHSHVQTPNLDQLANQGIMFTDTYAGSPICVPGRACMMTGTFASDNNSFGNALVWDGTNPTWGTLLRDAGYFTWATGKMDLNDDFDMGFTEKNTKHGHRHNPDITELFREPVGYRMDERPMVDGHIREERSVDHQRTLDALDFLRKTSPTLEQPWALFVGYIQPHPAFHALPEHFNYYYPNNVDMPNIPLGHLEDLHLVMQELRHFKRVATPIEPERIRKARAGYYGMITELDGYIGQLRNALEETGQLDNTVIIYTSDHGESLGEHGLWYKNNLYDVGIRVPLIISAPEFNGGKKVTTPVSHVDLVYTMLEWANAKRSPALRGDSLGSLLEGRSGRRPAFVYAENHSEGNITGSFMIRKSEWKYIHLTWYDDLLFNLKDDPGEFTNLVNHPEAQPILEELRGNLCSVVDPEEVTNRAFQKEDEMLRRFANTTSEEELVDMFKGRLGKGQARVMVSKLKRSQM